MCVCVFVRGGQGNWMIDNLVKLADTEKSVGSFCNSDSKREREIESAEKVLGPAGI